MPTCLVALAACSSDPPELGPLPVDLGESRQLVYVTAGPPSEHHKHGGATGKGGVYVFDRATLAPVAAFQVKGGAGEAVSTPDGSIVWIVQGAGNTVSLIDTVTRYRTPLPVGTTPEHSFITPSHDQIWVGNDGSPNVTVIDIATRSVLRTVVTGSGHHKVAFAEDDSGAFTFAYVSNVADSSITPVTPDGTALPNVTGVGASPHGIDYSRSTHHVYGCSGADDNAIEVIATRDDPATADTNEQHTVVARVPLAARCRYLRVDDAGGYAYALAPEGDALIRLDLDALTVTTYATGVSPEALELVDGRVYVANGGEPTVSVIDPSGVTVAQTLEVGNAGDPVSGEPGPRAIRRDGVHLFVTNAFDGTVTIYNVSTNTFVVRWDDLPNALGVTVAGPSGGTTYPR